jgi:hypothetical protein
MWQPLRAVVPNVQLGPYCWWPRMGSTFESKA